jgi:hypothetical protein
MSSDSTIFPHCSAVNETIKVLVAVFALYNCHSPNISLASKINDLHLSKFIGKPAISGGDNRKAIITILTKFLSFTIAVYMQFRFFAIFSSRNS